MPLLAPKLLPGRRGQAAFFCLALLPSLIAVGTLGRIHPDEVFQALEPAFHRVHGYGVLAWEWQPGVGIRNWAFPLLLASLLRAAHALGVDHPVAYRAVLALPQLLLHGLALLAVHRYAARRVGQGGAALATALVGLQGAVLAFAGRTLGESLSVSFLVLAAEALDRAEPGEARPAGAAGGLALGLAVVARYGSAAMVLAALAWLGATGRWRTLGFAVLAGMGVALGLGWLDLATWGRPFHSLIGYLDFNVLSDRAAQQFGREGAGFYLSPMLRWLPLWTWPGLAFAVAWQRPRLPLPAWMAAVYLVALLATPHKEERFLYPGLVLLSMAAAPGLVAWGQRLGARQGTLAPEGRPGSSGWGAALIAVSLAFSAGTLVAMPETRGDQLRAIVRATRGGAKGLLIVNEGLWGSGGYFYIGRKLPWLTADWPHDLAFQRAVADPRFNRAVTFEGRALDALQQAGFRVVGQIGRETLLERAP